MLPIDAGGMLLAIARSAIEEALGQPPAMAFDPPPWLQEKGACFVTLQQQGELRGCIGTVEARRPLIADVRANAVGAALYDLRFKPLQAREIGWTEIEVSVLSSLQPILFADERDAVASLREGVDGVLLAWRGQRSTFLPQVWRSLVSADEFLAQLKRKAGLAADFWADDLQLYRYTVSKWSENDLAKEELNG